MSNRLYLDQRNKRFVVLSYAGGTKYFRQITEKDPKNTFVPVNERSLSRKQCEYNTIQIVREPVQRFMSWFDKQYLKPLYREFDTEFKFWVNNLMTINWIDQYFDELSVLCHYNGHTNFQSSWPKWHLRTLYNEERWSYLKMEHIDPYFLNKPVYNPFRDSEQYVGVWDVLHPDTKEYTLGKIKKIYQYEIDWYNNLNFIQPK